MTQSDNQNENNNDPQPTPAGSVPIEFVQTPIEAPAPVEAQVEVATLEPEPEPHEFLAQALGVKPKKKKKAAQPITAAVNERTDELSNAQAKTEPVETEPVETETLETETLAPVAPAQEKLVSVADLGDDEEEIPAEELAAIALATTEAKDKNNSADAVSGPVKTEPAETEPADDGADIVIEADAEVAAAANENPFEDMQLAPNVIKAIATAGYDAPTPIQAATVPHLVDGRDLIGQAETGSGKTAAFAWPILSRIDLDQHAPQVIVLAPTRELAVQVAANFKKYASGMPGFRVTTIYGGQSYETQFRALDRGAHVVVGTPGRVMDHLDRGTLDLSQLKTFVLDEADEMLRMGFIDDIETILEKTPRTQQTVCFSATMPSQIKRIAERYLTDPVHIKIQSNSATADSIEQTCLFLSGREKLARLVRLLETEETDGVLVFVKTRQSTIVVSEHLIQKGVIASALNGDINQQQRERTVSQLKSGKIDIVVATDVAARGLDVQRISHVINYDFPHDTEAYVHRIGRTGRAGRAGHAILFVEPKEKGKLSRLQRATNQRIETFKEKSLKEINDIRVEKFKDRVKAKLEDTQVTFFQEVISQLQTETKLPVEQIAAALGVIAQGDQPLLLEAMQSKQSNWKKDGGRGGRGDHGPMQTYRVELGRRDNIGPGNLVGAITNEADLSNADIGRIRIQDRYSTIDLPANLPADIITHLAGVYVSGRPLEISKTDQAAGDDRGRGGRGGGGYRGRDSRGGGGRDTRGRGGRDSRGGRDFHGARDSRGSRDARPGQGDRGRSDRASSFNNAERSGRGDRNERAGRGERSYRGRDDRRPESGRGREGGFSRGGRDGGSSRDSAPRREGGFKRDFQRGGSDRPKRDGGSGYRGSDSPRRDSGSRPNAASSSSSPRSDSRTFTARDAKPGKTKAAQRAKQKRRPDAKPSSPVKKYVKIRGKKK
jgi:ATP-dependent RNA helicase DeaD